MHAADWFDDNRSVWLADRGEYVASPPVSRDLDVDVAIIGGGFTGVSTAYHLSERFPDKRIVLLEARTLANGASGRNGGQMIGGVFGFESHDPAQIARTHAATREAIDGIVAIIERHELDVPWSRDGHLEVFTNPRRAEAAAGRVERLAEAGLPHRFLDRSDLRARLGLEGVAGAVIDPGGGQLHGLAYLRALKPVLEARGVAIHEHTCVTRIREGRRIELTTAAASVRADAIVLGTNAYTPHLGYFRNRLVPIHSHVIATEPLQAAGWERLGWKPAIGFTDDRARLAYGTKLASGRLLFGGGSNATYDYLWGNGTRFPDVSARGAEGCRNSLLGYLPGAAGLKVTHRWSGPVALSLDRLCTMGVRGEHRNVYYALGYSGHGVTLANLAGRVLCDLYSGETARWRGMPFFERRLAFIPGEPFRSVGYHAYTRLTGRSPRSAFRPSTTDA